MSSSGLLPSSSRSLPVLLQSRREGRFHLFQAGKTGSFLGRVTQQFAPKKLVQHPQILAPQSNNIVRSSGSSSLGIASIHVDRVESRFLLAGGDDSIVSIYDLSKWGSEEYLDRSKKKINLSPSSSRLRSLRTSQSVHKPIARSLRNPPRNLLSGTTNDVQIPTGHSSPLTKVQWYPVDSGAFLSSSKDGSLLIWDTDSLSPVAECRPFDTRGICSFHLSPLRNHSAVAASLHDPAIKLVDIRSGASSHSLLGHFQQGVSSVQWAPHNDAILASGGFDGTVRIWDIRKAGSRACVAILNQDVTQPPPVEKAFKSDFSHLPKPRLNLDIDTFGTTTDSSVPTRTNRKQIITTTTANVAPNNYRPTMSSSVVSHGGSVSAISFGAQGHHLVSAGQDGNLHLWDLRASNGFMVPLRFLGPGQHPAISRQKKQIPMLLTPGGSSLVGQCWVGNRTSIFGFSLDRGGTAQQVLEGHLSNVTAIDTIEAQMQLLTAGKDGMILTWGKPRQQDRKRKIDDSDNW